MLFQVIFFLVIYLSGCFYYRNDSSGWFVLTKSLSTTNAICCLLTVLSENVSEYWDLLAPGNIYLLNGLYAFAAYLFVDGFFLFFTSRNQKNGEKITSLLHHFVGGLGIYLIAYNQMGLGLGLYFAGTEASTPFLNIWKLTSKHYNHNRSLVNFTFVLFAITFFIARIVTLPVLWYYIYINTSAIVKLHWFNQLMVYFGSGTLSILNLIWFVFILNKLTNL